MRLLPSTCGTKGGLAAHPAETAARSLDQFRFPNSAISPRFSNFQERTPALRHPLSFVPSPEELNHLLAGRLEEILHLQTLETPHSQNPQESRGSAQISGLRSPIPTSNSALGTSGGVRRIPGDHPAGDVWVPEGFGQLIGQALMAATRTVSPSLLAHSLHCYFLRPGTPAHRRCTAWNASGTGPPSPSAGVYSTVQYRTE